jgi:hypothetical protein
MDILYPILINAGFARSDVADIKIGAIAKFAINVIKDLAQMMMDMRAQ